VKIRAPADRTCAESWDRASSPSNGPETQAVRRAVGPGAGVFGRSPRKTEPVVPLSLADSCRRFGVPFAGRTALRPKTAFAPPPPCKRVLAATRPLLEGIRHPGSSVLIGHPGLAPPCRGRSATAEYGDGGPTTPRVELRARRYGLRTARPPNTAAPTLRPSRVCSQYGIFFFPSHFLFPTSPFLSPASLAFAPGCHPGTGPIKAAAIHVRRACGFQFFLSACTHTGCRFPMFSPTPR